jgi:hypothetical protein
MQYIHCTSYVCCVSRICCVGQWNCLLSPKRGKLYLTPGNSFLEEVVANRIFIPNMRDLIPNFRDIIARADTRERYGWSKFCAPTEHRITVQDWLQGESTRPRNLHCWRGTGLMNIYYGYWLLHSIQSDSSTLKWVAVWSQLLLEWHSP